MEHVKKLNINIVNGIKINVQHGLEQDIHVKILLIIGVA